jgi:hypothetical protein
VRQFLEILLPLILPTLIYVSYVVLARARGATGQPEVPWFWLAAAGGLLLVVTFVAIALLGGAPPTDRYLAPRMENGKIVPGQFQPAN